MRTINPLKVRTAYPTGLLHSKPPKNSILLGGKCLGSQIYPNLCAAHNFKKIVKAIVTGLIRPEFGNIATNQAI